MRRTVRSAPALAISPLAACEDSGGPRGPVSLSFAAATPAASARVASPGSASLQSIAVDPRAAGSRAAIEGRVAASFGAFEDDDDDRHDGRDDD
ncbi:MAG TPA: hypothetical protein VNA89_16660 [Gemmatimonadaceae bacterium]|nr:hypothetical protein [Gemmatimonadaceae bacterium]